MVEQKPWLKHYPPEIPASNQYDDKPRHQCCADSDENFGAVTAADARGKDVSFKQIVSEARKLAHFFQEKGLNKGDRVACMLPNSPQSVITYYGALMAGGVVVQVNPLFTERELTHMVEDSGAKFIMCLDILLPRVSNVRENTSLEHVIVTKIADYLPFPKNIVYPFI